MPDRKEIKLQIGTNVIQTGAAYDWNLLSIQGDDYMDVDVSITNLGAADGYNKEWETRLSQAKNEYYKFRHGANPTIVNNWTGKR